MIKLIFALLVILVFAYFNIKISTSEKPKLTCLDCGYSGKDFFRHVENEDLGVVFYRCNRCGSDRTVPYEKAVEKTVEDHCKTNTTPIFDD